MGRSRVRTTIFVEQKTMPNTAVSHGGVLFCRHGLLKKTIVVTDKLQLEKAAMPVTGRQRPEEAFQHLRPNAVTFFRGVLECQGG